MGLIRGVFWAAAVVALGATAYPASAHPYAALTAHDVGVYAAAFAAAEHGDAAAAEKDLAQVADPCLVGKVRYLELTHGKARGAGYDELASWLTSYGDMPGAGEVYELALKKKPEGAAPPAPAAAAVATALDGPLNLPPSRESRPARDAFFSGDITRALELARRGGDAWIAGLAAYRLGQYADAMVSFETLAANPSEPDATQAAGGFWAARAAVAAGQPERATAFLKIAAAMPDSFYGMIARRKLQLADDPLGRLIDTAIKDPPAPPPPALTPVAYAPAPQETAIERLIRTDARARRAVALMQLGRPIDAGAELRAGLAGAADDPERATWMGLMFELGPRQSTGEIVLHTAMPASGPKTSYPVPALNPQGGFTVDKALVYAVVWQESRFNSLAVSPVGAVGLMQLMPPSAASVAGDPRLVSDPIHLFDVGTNLALGQAYINWLEANAGGYDLMRTVAAYNGGPTTLARTEAQLGPGADTLLVIECFPYAETRAYVKKVMTAYWSYRRQFGAETRTLDAAASDLARIDARLDRSAPVEDPQPTSAPARQALEILLHRAG